LSERLVEKIALAQSALDSGAALAKLTEWVEATHR